MAVSVRTHMWIWWAHIAITHEQQARDARAALTQVEADANLLSQETYAALVAICACGFSLDALYGAVRDVLGQPPAAEANRGRTRRVGVILETLKRAFLITGEAGGGRWADEFHCLM
jgi:hypothetical protein